MEPADGLKKFNSSALPAMSFLLWLLGGNGPTWGRLLAFFGKVEWHFPTDWEIAVLHKTRNPLTIVETGIFRRG